VLSLIQHEQMHELQEGWLRENDTPCTTMQWLNQLWQTRGQDADILFKLLVELHAQYAWSAHQQLMIPVCFPH
jgi:hypothetical protein